MSADPLFYWGPYIIILIMADDWDFGGGEGVAKKPLCVWEQDTKRKNMF